MWRWWLVSQVKKLRNTNRPTQLVTQIKIKTEPRPYCAWVQHANHSATEPPSIRHMYTNTFKKIVSVTVGKCWLSVARVVFAYPDIRYPDLSVNFMAAKNPDMLKWKSGCLQQEAQLSPRDRAMPSVSLNLANFHATVQKLLVRQVLNKSKLWSCRVKVGRCVINMSTQPWRDRVFFHCLIGVINKPTTDRVVDITCIPTTCCGEIF